VPRADLTPVLMSDEFLLVLAGSKIGGAVPVEPKERDVAAAGGMIKAEGRKLSNGLTPPSSLTAVMGDVLRASMGIAASIGISAVT
jgi:hypothetical protein